MNLNKVFIFFKEKLRKYVYNRLYSKFLFWSLNKCKDSFSLVFVNLYGLFVDLYKLFLSFLRVTKRMREVSNKIERNLESANLDREKFRSALRRIPKQGSHYSHNKSNDLDPNASLSSIAVTQNTYFPLWAEDPDKYKRMRRGIFDEDDIDFESTEPANKEEETQEEEEPIPFRPEISGPVPAALGSEVESMREQLVHIEELPPSYVPISILHFYGLSDDFLSSDIFNNFILEDSIIRYFFFENDDEIKRFFHWPQEVLSTGQRASTTGLQTKPNLRYRRLGSRSLDRFKSSYRIAERNGGFVFGIYGASLRSRDVMLISRRHKVLGKEPWFSCLPTYILGPEIEHATYMPLVDNLVPFLIFARDEFEQAAMLDLFYTRPDKIKLFRNFSFFFPVYNDSVEHSGYNWRAYWAFGFLRFIRFYENFLFFYSSFFNSIIDILYLDVYLAYIKPVFSRIPGFNKFFYTRLYFKERSPVSEWLKTRADNHFKYRSRRKKRSFLLSILRVLHLVPKKDTLFQKSKSIRRVRKRFIRVLNKFNKVAMDDADRSALKILKRLKSSSNYAIPRSFYEDLVSTFWSKLSSFRILEPDFTSFYINFILHNSGVSSPSSSRIPSLKFNELELCLNRNAIDFRTAYYRSLKLRQTQNFSLKEVRALLNPLPSEVNMFWRLFPIYHERRALRPMTRLADVWTRAQDIDQEVLTDAARALYPGLDSSPLNEPIFTTILDQFDMAEGQYTVGDLSEAYFYHRDNDFDEEELIQDEFAKDQSELDLVYINKRSTEDLFSDENSTLLEEMEHMFGDDRYEYTAKSKIDQLTTAIKPEPVHEKLSMRQRIYNFFGGSRKTIDQIIEEEALKRVPGPGEDKEEEVTRVYGKRIDYSLDSEFDKAKFWYDSTFTKRMQKDRELLKGLVDMKIPAIIFNNYDLYSGVVDNLYAVPIQDIDTGFDKGNSSSTLLESFILENDKLHDDFEFDIAASRKTPSGAEADRKLKLNSGPNDSLEQFRKVVDFSFLYEWLRDKNISKTFSLPLYSIKKSGGDLGSLTMDFGYIPRFWRDRSFKTALRLDETRSVYLIFLQIFQALFFIFNFIFIWATFRYYLNRLSLQNTEMKADKRVEFLIKVYWCLLFCFLLFFIVVQYFTYDSTWLRDCVSYHFYSFYIAVCDAKESISGLTFTKVDDYTRVPPRFERVGGYNPFSSHALFVFVSYMSLYHYILFFMSIIVIFEVVKRTYMRTVESYLIFLFLQFLILNYLFFTTSMIEVFFIGKETLMLFTAFAIFFVAFILWFHGSGRRVKIRDRYIPYIIKLPIPDNSIVGNPDLLIKTLVAYYDHFKLVFPVIIKDILQVVTGAISWLFNYVKSEIKSFIIHRKSIWARREALSDRILEKRMRELDLKGKSGGQNYNNK